MDKCPVHRFLRLGLGLINTSPVRDSVKDALQGYAEVARKFEPDDARYLLNHAGHCDVVSRKRNGWFLTAELIRQTTFTGAEQDIRHHQLVVDGLAKARRIV
jgi:5,10-methylenetetrahydromethanopterin reductase